MVPRQIRLTFMPERPSSLYCMAVSFRLAALLRFAGNMAYGFLHQIGHDNLFDTAHQHGSILCFEFEIIPIQKNNLTSLSRLAVLFVLSAARRLVSLLFELV